MSVLAQESHSDVEYPISSCHHLEGASVRMTPCETRRHFGPGFGELAEWDKLYGACFPGGKQRDRFVEPLQMQLHALSSVYEGRHLEIPGKL